MNRPRVLLFGATGTVGRATANALVDSGYSVVCPIRSPRGKEFLPDVEIRLGNVTDPAWLADNVFHDVHGAAVISCLASRSGGPRDAWSIDCAAHKNILALAQGSFVRHFVLLSAICVQKPRLAFQHAKLEFETALRESGLRYSIVRPTALFKSLSGQVERVRRGKPFLFFGDGELTACKPISDGDLAAYLVGCLEEPSRYNRILPIGGPGPAMTPRQQGEQLFEVLGRPPRFRGVPPSLLSGAAKLLDGLAKVAPKLAEKAEFARIGHYYATESMLVLDPVSGQYDADATPETGREVLRDYQQALIDGRQSLDLGNHAMFRE